MHEAKSQLEQFMRTRRLSQGQLAVKARVSQSTVSRVLRGDPAKRYSGARNRLFKYARIRESVVIQPADNGIKRVVKTFEQIWDGSDAHAVAVSNVIRALAGLRPTAEGRKGSKHERRRKSTQKAPKANRAK